MAAYFTTISGRQVGPCHIQSTFWASDFVVIRNAQLDGHELERVMEHFPFFANHGERVMKLEGTDAQLAWVALASAKR